MSRSKMMADSDWLQCPGCVTSVLKHKLRIYGWLLVGLAPVWICGLAERFLKANEVIEDLFPLLAGMPLVASFWIVAWRHEAIEQWRLPVRARVLLVLVSLVGGAVAAGSMVMLSGRHW